MNSQNASRSELRPDQRQSQESLGAVEPELSKLAASQRKDEFIQRLIPLRGFLKSYIRRNLRVAYANQDIRIPYYTSGDIADEVVLRAYQQYDHKPPDLTLEQWMYRLANEVLEEYLRERKSEEKGRRSLEDLRAKELSGLEEVEHITADAEREVWLVEDLDDAEYYRREFTPPYESRTPEEELERMEELSSIVRALSRVPVRDRIVFELHAMEGLPKEVVATIADIPPDEVPRVVERVRQQVLQEIRADREQQAS